MNALDPQAVRRVRKKWRVAFLLCGMLLLTPLAFIFGLPKLITPERKTSPLCAEISRDFHARIEHLAPEEKLLAYFAQKKWRYGHDPAQGTYDIQIPAEKPGHRIDIRVHVVAGFVADVSIQDFYVSS